MKPRFLTKSGHYIVPSPSTTLPNVFNGLRNGNSFYCGLATKLFYFKFLLLQNCIHQFSKEWQKLGHLNIFNRRWAIWAVQCRLAGGLKIFSNLLNHGFLKKSMAKLTYVWVFFVKDSFICKTNTKLKFLYIALWHWH